MRYALKGAITFFLTCFLAVAPLTGLIAQEFRATISGTVTDPSGALIPGVTVAATNVDRNTSASTVTGDTGNFDRDVNGFAWPSGRTSKDSGSTA